MSLPDIPDDDNLPKPCADSEITQGVLPCDAWHHYYHYQSSAQYLWAAVTLRALGKQEEMLEAYTRAVFQDHFNEEALNGKKSAAQDMQGVQAPHYAKHPLYDLEFRSLTGELPDDATRPHDAGVTALLAGDLAQALAYCDQAIDAVPTHSNSYFARGKCYFAQKRFQEALADFTHAIRLSHQRHDAYHRTASAEHLARGRDFMKRGETDLAINDFTKALDLYKNNKDARAERARMYRVKGNDRLAREDEQLL